MDFDQNKFKLPHHTEQDGHGVFHRKTSYHKVTTLQLLNGWGDIVFLRKHYFNLFLVFQSFQWMSRVLQAVDSIHQVGVYCLALVPPNYLPKVGIYCIN